MVPDIIIRGQWLDGFLIYWAACVVLYFLITWIALKIHPLYYEWDVYPTIICRSLFLPILLPLRAYAVYRGRKRLRAINKEFTEDGTFAKMQPESYVCQVFEPPMPPPIDDRDEFSMELVAAWESYMEKLGEIEVARHHKEQSRSEDRGAPTSV